MLAVSETTLAATTKNSVCLLYFVLKHFQRCSIFRRLARQSEQNCKILIGNLKADLTKPNKFRNCEGNIVIH